MQYSQTINIIVTLIICINYNMLIYFNNFPIVLLVMIALGINADGKNCTKTCMLQCGVETIIFVLQCLLKDLNMMISTSQHTWSCLMVSKGSRRQLEKRSEGKQDERGKRRGIERERESRTFTQGFKIIGEKHAGNL